MQTKNIGEKKIENTEDWKEGLRDMSWKDNPLGENILNLKDVENFFEQKIEEARLGGFDDGQRYCQLNRYGKNVSSDMIYEEQLIRKTYFKNYIGEYRTSFDFKELDRIRHSNKSDN